MTFKAGGRSLRSAACLSAGRAIEHQVGLLSGRPGIPPVPVTYQDSFGPFLARKGQSGRLPPDLVADEQTWSLTSPRNERKFFWSFSFQEKDYT